jgi:hypothetical protein
MERFDRNPSPNLVQRPSRTRIVSWAAIILTLTAALFAWLLPNLPASRGSVENSRLAQQVKLSRRSRSPFRLGVRVAGLGGLLRRSTMDLADQQAIVDDLDREEDQVALGVIAPHLLDDPAAAPAVALLPIASRSTPLACPLRC